MAGRILKQNDCARLQFPRIGKVKIGFKDERGFPRSADYFIPSGKYAGLFAKAYGEKPQTIQIVFPCDDAELVCNEYYEYRSDKGELIAKGDGETFSIWNGSKYNVLKQEDYPDVDFLKGVQEKYPNKLSRTTGDGWRVRLTLNFLLPLVRGVAGVWTFETNGNLSTIPNLRDTFDAMAEQGKVAGVIFDLNVQYAKSQKPDTQSRYPVVTLVPNESEENIRKVIEAKKPIKLIENN